MLAFCLPAQALLSWLDAMGMRSERCNWTDGPGSPRHVLARPGYLVACNAAALADADAHAVLCGAVRDVAASCSTADRQNEPDRRGGDDDGLVGRGAWASRAVEHLTVRCCSPPLCCCRIRQLESREPLSNPLYFWAVSLWAEVSNSFTYTSEVRRMMIVCRQTGRQVQQGLREKETKVRKVPAGRIRGRGARSSSRSGSATNKMAALPGIKSDGD